MKNKNKYFNMAVFVISLFSLVNTNSVLAAHKAINRAVVLDVNLSISTVGGLKHYNICIPDAASDVTFTLTPGSAVPGDQQLLLNLGSPALPGSAFWFASHGPGVETFNIFNPIPGTYYIAVEAIQVFENANLNVTWSLPPGSATCDSSSGGGND